MRTKEDPLVLLLIRDEGLCLFPYRDSLGFWTIGVGHLIDGRKGGSLPEYIRSFPLTDAEALRLLNDDINECHYQLNLRLPWWQRLSETRKNVLLSMVFQMGMAGVLKFNTFLRNLEEENYSGAASSMQASLWAKQTPERVDRLAAMMLTG